MRGFRASRAAQNSKSSRFGSGKGVTFQIVTENYQNFAQQQAELRKKLPDWLRMPAEGESAGGGGKVIKLKARKSKAAKPATASASASASGGKGGRVKKAA